MRKLMLLVLFLAAAACSAQVKLETNKEGVFHIRKEWKPLNITAEPEATEYGKYFFRAILSPGEKISVKRTEKLLELKPIFKAQKEIDEHFIVYDDSAKTIRYLESKKQREGTSYWILFGIIAIALMIISNIIELIEKRIDRLIISDTDAGYFLNLLICGSAFGATVIAGVVGATIAAIAAGIATVVAVFNFVIIHHIYWDGWGQALHKQSVKLYYLFMAIHLVFIFL